MPSSKLPQALAVLALSGALGGASLAGAGPAAQGNDPVRLEARGSTTIKYERRAFHGRVEVGRPNYPEHLDNYPSTRETFYAAVEDCLARRDVTLLKRRDGRTARVGDARTDGRGAWSIDKRRARGRYFARVDAKRVSSLADDPDYGVLIVCSATASDVLRVRR